MDAIWIYVAVPVVLAIIELNRLKRTGRRRELLYASLFLFVGVVLSMMVAIRVVPSQSFFGMGIVLEPVGRLLQEIFAIDAGGSS